MMRVQFSMEGDISLNILITTNTEYLLYCALDIYLFVKLRRGSGKDWQGMALKAKGLKA